MVVLGAGIVGHGSSQAPTYTPNRKRPALRRASFLEADSREAIVLERLVTA
jgi:hypothetical protein